MDKLVFDSTLHQYTLNGKPMESASNLVKKVTPEFDRFKVSMMLSNKRGVPQQEILAEWDRTRDISISRGELVHSFIEDHMAEKGDFMMSSMPECQAFKNAWAYLKEEYDAELIDNERVVYCESFRIAGRVDSILALKQTGQMFKGKVVFDWKTGKYKTSNPFEKMLAPFSDLDNCEHVKASIQTSLYRIMLASHQVDTVDAQIVHLGSDGNYSILRAIDLRTRIQRWLTQGN